MTTFCWLPPLRVVIASVVRPSLIRSRSMYVSSRRALRRRESTPALASSRSVGIAKFSRIGIHSKIDSARRSRGT